MATVNEDGSPHNSPLVLLYNQNFTHIYWGSHPDSQHSQNILRTQQAFFTIYDSHEGKTGLYIKTKNAGIVADENLETALDIHNKFRQNRNKKPINIEYYQGDSTQKMWQAEVETVWINEYQRDEAGLLIKDFKVEVDRLDLLKILQTKINSFV